MIETYEQIVARKSRHEARLARSIGSENPHKDERIAFWSFQVAHAQKELDRLREAA